MSALAVKRELRKLSNREKADVYKWFFKTGKGEYGEGDSFIGVVVPICRIIAKKYSEVSMSAVKSLLKSKVHEERMVALFILVDKFQKREVTEKEIIYKFYLDNTKYINNWDLVDLSAHKIVGAYLWENPQKQKVLNTLAQSNSLWERRIAIISTFHFIHNNSYTQALQLAEILLPDKHDLIQKAVGWMLREIGKRDREVEEEFLKRHYKKMSRTSLRYAIEKFSPEIRKRYLRGTI